MKSRQEAAISRLKDIICERHGVEGVFLVGSYARGLPDAEDLDLLVVSRGVNTDSVRQALYAQAEHLTEAGAIQLSGDAVRFELDSLTVDLACVDVEELSNTIRSFATGEDIMGERCPWAPACRIPEAVAHDLIMAKDVHDPRGMRKGWLELLLPYPTRARDAILFYCAQEVRLKSGALQRRVHGMEPTERCLLLADVVCALIRYAYALDRRYLPGFKRSLEEGPVGTIAADILACARRASTALCSYRAGPFIEIMTRAMQLMDSRHSE